MRIKFNGWDWTELMQLQQIATNWPELPKKFTYDEKEFLNVEDASHSFLIRTYLGSLTGCAGDSRKKEQKRVAAYIRKFCIALSRCKADCSNQLYLGMSKIEHDETLIIWTLRNLECMWT